ncbi:MAG: DNA translocase FtsK, partial [Oxalobacteraceae bacterium]
MSLRTPGKFGGWAMASRAQPSLLRDTMKAGARRSMALIGGTALFLAVVGSVLALLTFHSQDPSLNTASGGPTQNLLVPLGAWVADLLLASFGLPVILLAPVGLILVNRLWLNRPVGDWSRMLRGVLIGTALVASAVAFFSSDAVLSLPAGWGGLVGLTVAGLFNFLIGFAGEPVLTWWAGRGLGLLFGLIGLFIWWRSLDFTLPERPFSLPQLRLPEVKKLALAAPESITPVRETVAEPRKTVVPDTRPGPVIADRGVMPAPARAKPPTQTSLDFKDSYKLPGLDLLKATPVNKNAGIDKAALERNARLLESVLDDFNVKGQIVEVRPGPVVTMYELEPASGIKASRVIQLA